MVTRRLPTEQRQAQIAEVALRLLAEHGPAGLTLAELGNAVGIADASLLRHFKDKQAIIDAAIALFGRLLDEDLVADTEDPLQRLGEFFVRRLAKIRERPELLELAYNSRLRDAANEVGAASVDEHIGRSARYVRTCLEDAQRLGQLSDDMPPLLWSWIIAGLLRGASSGLPTPLLGDSTSAAAAAELSPEQTWKLIERVLRRA